MKHRHDRFAVVLALAGVIAVAPVFTAAAERQTGATTTQPAPAAPPAAATPKTPAAPPPLPAILAVQIKLKCVVASGWSGKESIQVTNSTSGTLPAGQKISWRFLGVQKHGRLQPPRRATVFTLQVPLPPAHTIKVADDTVVKKLIEIEAEKAKGDFATSCEAFAGG